MCSHGNNLSQPTTKILMRKKIFNTNENDLIEVGIIDIKVGQLAAFFFHHLCLCLMCDTPAMNKVFLL